METHTQAGSGIRNDCVQEVLESASNAASRGLSQFLTPYDFGKLLALGFPSIRPVIVDLECGSGQLLNACIGKDTHTQLGSDIDSIPWASQPKEKDADLVLDQVATMAQSWNSSQQQTVVKPDVRHIKITSDVTLAYPRLVEVEWFADCFVLNPPWDLFFHRDRLMDLAKSECDAVREAFPIRDGRTPPGDIDSTMSTIMMALDRMTTYGEAVLIGNEATLQRLLLSPGAPYKALRRHIWCHLSVLGNIITGIQDSAFQKGEQFKTGIIFFARDHEEGIRLEFQDIEYANLKATMIQVRSRRDDERFGNTIRAAYSVCDSTIEKWRAAGEEIKIRQAAAKQGRTDFNLWLTRAGEIGVNLSLYDQHSVKIDKQAAKRLFNLSGKRPMQLVLARAERNELEKTVNSSVWRVDPLLQEAVREAVLEYHSVRAPLVELPPIQRLGYLDENDNILCTSDWKGFKSGCSYAVTTQTTKVTRYKTRMSLSGEPESLELTGSELAIFVTDESGKQVCFMDATLMTDSVDLGGVTMDSTLQELVGHFHIPDVPDQATARFDEYKQNKMTLESIFTAINA